MVQNTWYRDATVNQPNNDMSPFEIIHRLNKMFLCKVLLPLTLNLTLTNPNPN
jgi:hypothetical protein